MRARLFVITVLLVSSPFVTGGCKLRDRLRRDRAGTTSTAAATSLPPVPPPPEPPADTWAEIDLYDIAVSFPRTPQLKTRTETFPQGTANVREYMLSYGESFFAATIADMPAVTAWNAQGSVDGAVTQSLAGVRKSEGVLSVTTTSDMPKPFAGMPGREIVATVDAVDHGRKMKATYRMISLSRYGRNYAVLGLAVASDQPILDRIFASLRATPKAKAVASAKLR